MLPVTRVASLGSSPLTLRNTYEHGDAPTVISVKTSCKVTFSAPFNFKLSLNRPDIKGVLAVSRIHTVCVDICIFQDG